MQSDISVTLQDAYGVSLSEKEISFEGDVRLLSSNVITNINGISTVSADVPWDGGWDIMRTLTTLFPGDTTYTPADSDIAVREISYSNEPTPGPVPQLLVLR